MITLSLEETASLLSELGVPEPVVSIHSLAGGTNNSVYRVDLLQTSLILKIYSQDNRNRLSNEFAFLKYAGEKRLRCIPHPIACFPLRNLAFYSYLPGRNTMPSDATFEFISQALHLYLTLNQERQFGQHLSDASDACFSLKSALESVEKRIDRLFSLVPIDSIDLDFFRFLRETLHPLWLLIKERTEKAAAHHGIDSEQILSRTEAALSPSDFGLHNALVDDQNTFYFIDFEYAGWDDPAKTVSDFFTQPRSHLSLQFLPSFAQSVAQILLHPEDFLKRISILFPVCQMKWTCVFLNAFFKNSSSKDEQLYKAKQYLQHFQWEAF